MVEAAGGRVNRWPGSGGVRYLGDLVGEFVKMVEVMVPGVAKIAAGGSGAAGG